MSPSGVENNIITCYNITVIIRIFLTMVREEVRSYCIFFSKTFTVLLYDKRSKHSFWEHWANISDIVCCSPIFWMVWGRMVLGPLKTLMNVWMWINEKWWSGLMCYFALSSHTLCSYGTTWQPPVNHWPDIHPLKNHYSITAIMTMHSIQNQQPLKELPIHCDRHMSNAFLLTICL